MKIISIYEIDPNDGEVLRIKNAWNKGGDLHIKDRFNILGNNINLALDFKNEVLTDITLKFDIGQKDFDEKAGLVLAEAERVCDGLESINKESMENIREKWGFSKERIADDTYLRYYIGLNSFDAKKYLDLTISKLST